MAAIKQSRQKKAVRLVRTGNPAHSHMFDDTETLVKAWAYSSDLTGERLAKLGIKITKIR